MRRRHRGSFGVRILGCSGPPGALEASHRRFCAEFCARWDQNSFDPDFAIHDLDSFADEVREVFDRPQWADDVVAVGSESLVVGF